MKMNKLFSVATVLILTSVSWASEISDTTPPRLASIAISPAVIDTSTNSQSILLTVRLTDELSGMTAPGPLTPSRAGAWAAFRSPAGGSDSPAPSVQFLPSMRVSGDEFDGVYTNALILPRFSHAGNWTLFQFDVTDAVGNQRQMSLAELRGLGFPTKFTVEGADDRNPPELVSVSINSTTVDTSSSNQPITITVRLRDNLAGLDRLPIPTGYQPSQISFVSPSKGQHVGTYFAQEKRESGDQYDGVYTNTIWLPRYSEPGTWSMDSILLVDAAGNQQRMELAEFLDRGFSAEFTVQGTGDVAPPQIRALDFFPRRIDTSSSNQTIVVTTRLLDTLSGMSNSVPYYASWGQASATFVSPSKGQSASVSFYGWWRVAGTDFDGIYTNTMILPRFSETGVWTLWDFNLTDGAGNSTRLESPDLRQLGFPTQFAIGIAPSLRITRQAGSMLLSWPAWASQFSLQSLQDFGQSKAWAPVALAPVVIGEDAVVAVPVSAEREFYRLAEQP